MTSLSENRLHVDDAIPQALEDATGCTGPVCPDPRIQKHLHDLHYDSSAPESKQRNAPRTDSACIRSLTRPLSTRTARSVPVTHHSLRHRPRPHCGRSRLRSALTSLHQCKDAGCRSVDFRALSAERLPGTGSMCSVYLESGRRMLQAKRSTSRIVRSGKDAIRNLAKLSW